MCWWEKLECILILKEINSPVLFTVLSISGCVGSSIRQTTLGSWGFPSLQYEQSSKAGCFAWLIRYFQFFKLNFCNYYNFNKVYFKNLQINKKMLHTKISQIQRLSNSINFYQVRIGIRGRSCEAPHSILHFQCWIYVMHLSTTQNKQMPITELALEKQLALYPLS